MRILDYPSREVVTTEADQQERFLRRFRGVMRCEREVLSLCANENLSREQAINRLYQEVATGPQD